VTPKKIRDLTGIDKARVAVALGSGLGTKMITSLVDGGPVPYTDIVGMPPATVVGHEGSLYFGDIGGTTALFFSGRAHLYEGHDARAVTHWVRAAVEAGCDTIVLTNAAGAVNPELEIGSPCLISDHINLTGANPLSGPNDETVGPRFLDLSDAYDRELRALARSVDSGLQEGVYAGLAGPTYETPAEVRMLARMGADLVGMSTVLETIQARYLGARVLGISIVSNPAAGVGKEPLSHDEVAAVGRDVAARLEHILRGVISEL
jgi:purine-nucleoside phosphorylase